jgi:hypothetical protein
MRSKIAALACIVVLTLAPLAPRAAVAQWPVDGFVVSDHWAYWNDNVQLFPDGSGGVLCGWKFHGGGDTQLFASRVTSVGTLAAGWPANGLSLYSVHDGATAPDGAGGLMIAASRYAVPTNDEIYEWHVLSTGSFDWSGQAAPAASELRSGRVIADGAGGSYVAWTKGIGQLYLQHLQSNGVRFPGWPVAGLLVSGSSTFFVYDRVELASDGAGGVFVMWMSDYTRLQRVTASGTLAPGWPSGGIALGISQPYYYGVFKIVPSGADHLVVVWQDVPQSSSSHLILERVAFDGSLDAAWPAGGLVAADGAGAEVVADATSDGSDGVLLAWTVAGANARGQRYLADGSRASGWPASGALLRSGTIGSWAMTSSGSGGMVFAWGGHVQWFLADGTQDPSQPSGGQLVHPTYPAVTIRSLMPDGGGGVFVAWDKRDTLYGRNTLMLSRVTYPTPLAVSPRVARTPDLRLIGPNPSRGDFAMSCTIAAGAPARLELLDLAGRRLRVVELDGGGTRTARFDDVGSLRPGLYLIRLTQAALSRTSRIAIVH